LAEYYGGELAGILKPIQSKRAVDKDDFKAHFIMEQIRADKQWRKDLVITVANGLNINHNELHLSSIQEFLTFCRRWAADVKFAQDNKAKNNGRRSTG
jgi:energy-converting hydrogenase A subunit M